MLHLVQLAVFCHDCFREQLRNGRRAIIIAIDERVREINKNNHLNCLDIKDIDHLPDIINSKF